MLDMSQTIAVKSDQLNADDLIGKTLTITITKVTGGDSAEQPVNVYYEGDGGKPFKPCKTIRRVMVLAWGKDASQYAGRSMTLYRDPSVKFGGMEVGGIRVSHMSHIDGKLILALMASKGKKKPYEVLPLKAQVHQHPANERTQAEQADVEKRTDAWATKYIDAVQNAMTDDELSGIRKRQAEKLAWVRDNYPAIYTRVIEADPHSAIQPAADTSDAGNQGEDRAGEPELTDN